MRTGQGNSLSTPDRRKKVNLRDFTRTTNVCACELKSIGYQKPFASPRPGRSSEDDEQLLGILVRMWSLASGRYLPPGVRPNELGPKEMIAFWADDFDVPSGRHAAPNPLYAGAAL